MPGLINTHTHAPMVLYRGLADDLALMDWLQKYIFPAEAKTVSPEFVRAGTRLAALEMIQSGTTTYADMYYFEEEIARVTKAAGLRGVLGQTIIQFPVADAKTPADGLARTEAFVEGVCRRRADRAGRRAARDVYARRGDAEGVRALADRPHVAGHDPSRRDGGRDRRRRARSTSDADRVPRVDRLLGAAHARRARRLVDAGATSPILARRHVGVSHNPESNMKLASGTAKVAGDARGRRRRRPRHRRRRQQQRSRHVRGDAAGGVPAQAADHRSARDSGARRALEMATIDGARALGMEKEIGSLEPGKRADLIVVSMAPARQTPMYDPAVAPVYVTRGDDVRTTIVNGKVLMRDRRVLTLNEAAGARRARSAFAEKVRAAVSNSDGHDERAAGSRDDSSTHARARRGDRARLPGRRGDPPGRACSRAASCSWRTSSAR